jgi:hypothetical protein
LFCETAEQAALQSTENGSRTGSFIQREQVVTIPNPIPTNTWTRRRHDRSFLPKSQRDNDLLYRKLKGDVEYFGNETFADIPPEFKEDFLEFVLIEWRTAADGDATVLNEIRNVSQYPSCSFSSTDDSGVQIQDGTVASVDSPPPSRGLREYLQHSYSPASLESQVSSTLLSFGVNRVE